MFLGSRITTGDCLLVNFAFGEEGKIILYYILYSTQQTTVHNHGFATQLPWVAAVVAPLVSYNCKVPATLDNECAAAAQAWPCSHRLPTTQHPSLLISAQNTRAPGRMRGEQCLGTALLQDRLFLQPVPSKDCNTRLHPFFSSWLPLSAASRL